jgi:hypothetical protein
MVPKPDQESILVKIRIVLKAMPFRKKSVILYQLEDFITLFDVLILICFILVLNLLIILLLLFYN